jgi:TetR/AcrR family transcriptional repressor of mexJK operon
VTAVERPLRAGSLAKRSAILTAARDLFLTDGFERTSVDAIASAAGGVSKRTIYDYFGDKAALLLAVVEESVGGLLASVRAAVDDELGDEVSSREELQTALLSFVDRVAATTLGSADYVALVGLVRAEAAHLPGLAARWTAREPEDLLAERFAHFHDVGLLRVPKPRTAADHFTALTFGLSQSETPLAIAVPTSRRDEILRDGVDAFLRAYAV